nr:hypothetical protein [Sphingomonas psychrotolerans]
MRVLLLAAPLAVLFSPGASVSSQVERVPVTIRLVGDDALTQRLRNGLESDLQRNSTLRLASSVDRDVIYIESNSNVDWDELGGRTVVIYTVYVFRGDNRGAPHTGICYERGISKCVDAITRLARIETERL